MISRGRLSASYIALTVAVILSLFPLLWLFLTSIKPPALTFTRPPTWIFEPTLENYTEVFLHSPFVKYVFNSALVALATTLIALSSGTLAAYAFARFRFAGRRTLQLLMLLPKVIPPVAVIIPLFVLFRTVNLIDNHIALILSYLSFTIPIAVWMMTGFIQDIPVSIEESAIIDGASKWQILSRIVVPLVAPGMAAAGILCFIYSWNEFLFAVILTRSTARTVPVAITGFITHRAILWGRMAAAGTVVLMPIFAFALSVQRHLVRGLSQGAVKG
jgi:multiple sugar transport system permease protein